MTKIPSKKNAHFNSHISNSGVEKVKHPSTKVIGSRTPGANSKSQSPDHRDNRCVGGKLQHKEVLGTGPRTPAAGRKKSNKK